MKANWLTSIVTGICFGALVAFMRPDNAGTAIGIGLFFFGSVIVGVIGLSQLRDIYRVRKERGWSVGELQVAPEDLKTYYLPAWGRMFLWFISVALTSMLLPLLRN